MSRPTPTLRLALAIVASFATAIATASRVGSETLQAEMVTVNGTLHVVAGRGADRGVLEIDSVLGGRFRVDESNRLGRDLRQHTGGEVTVVASVERVDAEGRPKLRVESCTFFFR